MRRQDGISTEAVGRAAQAGASVVLSQLVDCVNAAVLPRTRVSEPTDVGERRCYEEKRAIAEGRAEGAMRGVTAERSEGRA